MQMVVAMWVKPFKVSRFPGDVPVSYQALCCLYVPECSGACRHLVVWPRSLRAAKQEAITLHQMMCEGQDQCMSTTGRESG